jgi:uncharacterized protein involved in exopolysaccharide biosynthesis
MSVAEHNRSATTPADAPLDLGGLLHLLWRRRLWIVAATALFGLAGLVTAFLIAPVYEVRVVLAPANTERGAAALGGGMGQLGGLASLVGLSGALDGSGTEEALAVLRSRQFTERFIQERKVVGALYPNRWDREKDQCTVAAEDCPTLARAFERFDSRVRSITSDRRSGLVTLVLRWHDGREAADWANDLVQRLNSEMRNRAITEANASLGHLERELQTTAHVETRDAVNRLIEGQVKRRMLANVSAEYAFRVIDPASEPDPRDPVFPKKWLLALLAAVAGFVLSILISLAAFEIAARRTPRAAAA